MISFLLLSDFGINTDGANTLSTDSPAVDNPRDTYKEHFLRRKSSTQYRRLQHRTFVEMDPNYFGELSPIGGAYYQPAPEWSLPPLHPFNTPAHREGDQQGGLWQPPSVLDHGSSRLQPAFENPFRY